MDSAPIIFLKLYGPAICALVTLVAFVAYRDDGTGSAAVVKPFGSFLDVRLPLSHRFIVRAVLGAAAGVFLSGYLFVDYVPFFPSRLKMDVFYEVDGLEEALNALGPGARELLRVPPDYAEKRAEYFRYLDEEVRKIVPSKSFFSVQGGLVHSEGETTFIVEKIGGIQHYHISESVGQLTHTLDLPNTPRAEFRTLFQKQSTKGDFLDFTLGDLLFRRSVLVQPAFKQLISHGASDSTIEFKVAIVSATRIIVLPWPDFTSTVYLADFGNAGRIPIAYAKYR